jgi:hypothetical protein
MSPNHYLNLNSNGLAVYYSGESPVYVFDDEFLCENACDFPISPSVRNYIYEYMDTNGSRDICYAFDGGIENGIDTAQDWVSQACEAYVKLPAQDKIDLNETTTKMLIKKESKISDEYSSASKLITKIQEFIVNEDANDTYNSNVIESLKSYMTNKFDKYKARKEQIRLDIQAEKEWTLNAYETYDPDDEIDEEEQSDEESGDSSTFSD